MRKPKVKNTDPVLALRCGDIYTSFVFTGLEDAIEKALPLYGVTSICNLRTGETVWKRP